MEKLFSRKPVPDIKTVGDQCANPLRTCCRLPVKWPRIPAGVVTVRSFCSVMGQHGGKNRGPLMGLCSGRPQPPPRSSGQGPLPFSNVLSSWPHTWSSRSYWCSAPFFPLRQHAWGISGSKFPRNCPRACLPWTALYFCYLCKAGSKVLTHSGSPEGLAMRSG